MTKTLARILELRAVKFCIINAYLFWKDPRGLLLNCVTEDEAGTFIEEFHNGMCGAHFYWKETINKILIRRFQLVV